MNALLFLEKVYHDHFPWILMGFLGLGILVPATSAAVNPYLLYILMIVLFFNFLKIDFTTLLDEVKSWPYQVYLAAYTLLFFPAVAYGVSRLLTPVLHLDPQVNLAVLLFFASPTAAAAPTLAIVFKGRFERTLLNLILTSLLVPFSLPLMLWILERQSVAISYLHMAERLTLMVFVPFVASLFLRRVAPKFTAKVVPRAPFLAIFFLSFLTLGGVAGVRPVVMAHPGEVGVILIYILGLMGLAFVFGWFLALRTDKADRITLALSNTWVNVSLTLVVANEFFKERAPIALTAVALTFIPWNLSFVPAKWIIRRIMAGEGEGR